MTANRIQLALLIDQDHSLTTAGSVGVAVALPADAPTGWYALAKELRVPIAVLDVRRGSGDCMLSSADDALRNQAIRHVDEVLHQSARCGARLVTVTPGCDRVSRLDSQDYAEALHKTLLSLRSLSLCAATAGVQVAIRVATGGFLLSPIEARDLLESVGRPETTACLDLHAVAGISFPLDWIRTLRHRLGCVCCRASDLVQVGAITACLAEIGFNGPLICETDAASAADCLEEIALSIQAAHQAR